MANKVKEFFKNIFAKAKEAKQIRMNGGVKNAAIVPKGSTGWEVWSFHPESGMIRKETGTLYVQAPNIRKASRHFKKEIEKKTGKKFHLEIPE